MSLYNLSHMNYEWGRSDSPKENWCDLIKTERLNTESVNESFDDGNSHSYFYWNMYFKMLAWWLFLKQETPECSCYFWLCLESGEQYHWFVGNVDLRLTYNVLEYQKSSIIQKKAREWKQRIKEAGKNYTELEDVLN